MQKNLTSFFGKVAAVSPLVGSNDIRDLTAVTDNYCKRAAISPSIEAAAASSAADTTKQKESLQDNSNLSIVTPSSSAEKSIQQNATEDSYSIEFDRLQDTSSSPQQSKKESNIVDLVKSDEIVIIEEPEYKNGIPQIISQSTNKKSVVAKKPRAPKPRNTNPVKRKPIKQKDALEGIAITSPAPLLSADIEEGSEVVAMDENPIIITTVDLVDVDSSSIEPTERGADVTAEEEKKETSGVPQPKKRKSKKPDMYADENYVKPKRVRKKKSEDVASITGSISETLTSPSGSSPSVKAPATNTITGFMTESTTTMTIVPFATDPAAKTPTFTAPTVVMPKPLPEYSPEIVAKIKSFKEKALALCSELAALEKCPDLHDNMIDVTAAQDDLVQFCKKASATEINEKGADLDVAHSLPAVSEEEMVLVVDICEQEANGEPVEDKNVSSSVAVSSATATAPAMVVDTNTAEWKCKAIISRCMQGSPNKLSQSIPVVRASLAATLEALASTTASLFNDEERKSTGAETCLSQLLESEEKLSEFIKEVAGRESYGHRQRSGGATVAVNEDDDQVAIYRWEVHNSALYLSAPGQSAAKELRTVRKRYGKAVRATHRVIEQLQSMRGVATETEANKGKVATLEDVLAKSMAEIEKAKGRRLELLKKRALEAEEKARKEEAKEAKKREREEKLAAAVVAAQEKEKEKEKEKDKKKSSTAAAEKEKKPTVASSNPLLKFFVLGKDKPSVVTSSSDINGDRDIKAPSATSSSSSSAAIDSSAPSTSAAVSDTIVVDLFAEEELFEQRKKQFNDSIASTLAMSDILLRNKEWSRQAHQKHLISQAEWRSKTNKQPRRLTSITVSLTVSSNDFGGDDDRNYCEIRDVFVDNKIRTLSFCEDHRPAYVGTWSKRSRCITGRRPFGRDDELLNYDYDSEAEWEEEEDDGEDIMESDEEDKKEKGGEDSELEYDEMFCKDDDFGSDVDSDRGEIAAAVKNVVGVGHRIGEDVCGPKFLRLKADIGSSSSNEECDRQRDMQIYFRPPHVSLLASDSAEEEEVVDGYYKDVVKDSDAVKLSRFTAVVFATPDAMPFLGDHKKNHIPRGGGSTKKKKKKAVKEDDSGRGEDSELNKDSSTEGKNATGKITESDVVALLQYIHGKKDGLEKMVIGFHELHPTVSKAGIKRKIQEAAHRQKREDGSCSAKWTVNQEFLVKANLTNIELPVLEMSPLKKKKRKISETVADGQGRAKEAKGVADLTAAGIVPLPAPTKRSHPFAQNLSIPPAVPADTSSSADTPPERSATDETDPAAQQDQDKPSAATSIGAEEIEVASSESNGLPVEIAGKTGEGGKLLPSNHPVAAVAVAVQPSSKHNDVTGSHRRVIDAARGGKSKSKASPLAAKKAKTSVNCRKITDFASMKTKRSPDRVANAGSVVVVDLSGDTEESGIIDTSPPTGAAKALAGPSLPTPTDPLEAELILEATDILLSDNCQAPDTAAAPAAPTASSESTSSGDGTIVGDRP